MSEPRATFDAGAKKHLGQHFLHEKGIIGKIVQAVDPKPGDRLVEIGPGQGAITFPLLDRHGELTVIEFDRDLIAPLTDAARAHGMLTIVHRDVLQVDFTALAAGMHPDGGQIRLVGNLPYNLSSPILFHALDHAAAIRDMHFMLQKEVVDRMAAAPGSKVYGRLSVMLQAYCRVVPLFKVPPGAFRPPPLRLLIGRNRVSGWDHRGGAESGTTWTGSPSSYHRRPSPRELPSAAGSCRT